MKLSEHFTLAEFTRSTTATARGIKNEPTAEVIANLQYLVTTVLEPLRVAMGHAVPIGSGYRCKALNTAVGGVSNSQHLTGQAADLCISGDKAKGQKWYNWIKSNVPYDQLIWERNKKTGSYWVHVSVKKSGNRKQAIPLLDK